jgi:cell wall-associated NlpC family hydrolase
VHLRRSGLRIRTAVAVLAALASVTGLLAAATDSAGAAPPPNPSNSQIQSAQQIKTSLAQEVGVLAAQAAQMQTRLNQLMAQKELAEQKLALALSKLAEAKAAAVTAAHNVVTAEQKVVEAQANFIGYVQASYESGDINGTTGTLLTASDPNVLLQQSALQQYQASHELNAVGDMQRAGVAKSNADAAARLAVQTQAAATNAATSAEKAAEGAVAAAQQQQQQLQAAIAANATKLQAAQEQLATLNHERSQFLAYQAEQARLRALAIARAAAAEAAARAHHSNGGGGGGGGSQVPAGSGGSWTAAKGRTAVARAEHWLGWPYAWAGGNADGPTYGVCAGDGAFNDCHVIGFDCSGLAMNAWPQAGLAHYAATQYLQGSYHPSMGNLMPGDLVFWSSDGSVGGIHHVAIYIGGGMVIQAPESGSVIQETPLYNVSWGLFGATRPLT